MSKRTNETITLGSGKVYYDEFSGSLPTLQQICVDAKRLGYVKGGATLEYTEETYTESDDLGMVKKIITTSEEAKLKLGLITFNNDTLNVLIDRGSVTTASGKRTLKIGGADKAKNKNYVICFHHEDSEDGDVWILLVGRNTAGLTLAFAKDAGTNIEPEFTAVPQDDNGTLVQIIEEIDIEGGK